jgi:muconate cycloisomerase
LDDSIATIRAMDAVGNLRILEDPFPRTALSETKALRERISARVVIHIDPPEMLAEVLRSEVCGGLNIDSHTQGLFGWRMQAAAADAFNLPVWHGSGNDLGIFTAAQLHLAASAPNCQLPGDQAGPWIRESTLVEEAFVVESGHVRVSQGPGLGVTVDRAALDRYGVLAGEAYER